METLESKPEMISGISQGTRIACRSCKSLRLQSLVDIPGFPKAAQHFLTSLNDTSDDIAVTLRVAECSDCGLTQLCNQPVHYYRDVITAASISDISRASLIEEWSAIIDEFNLSGCNAIEIGAGKGEFLAVLEHFKIQAYGLENSPSSVNYALECGRNLRQGYITDMEFADQFDLVVCNNFLEHQPDTRSFLQALNVALKPEAVLYISVPNFDYLLSKSCLYEFVADHLVYFTAGTFKRTIESHGFAIVNQYIKNNGNDLVIVAKKRCTPNFELHTSNLSKIVSSFTKFINSARSDQKKICCWGAGHRALALLAMADATYVSYIIDSAPFKQGLFAPITHIPIKSPEFLIEDGCDILILMLPGSYANQVKHFLSDHVVSCRVVIFDDNPIEEYYSHGVI